MMMIYNNNENNIADCSQYINQFEIFQNGTKTKINNSNEKFNKIKSKVEDLFLSARLMPAFGVSLHDEIIKEIENGCWLKIEFAQEIRKNGLPFTSLLFRLEEVQGFNAIRLHNGKFEGRCLFLDLDENYDLSNLIT